MCHGVPFEVSPIEEVEEDLTYMNKGFTQSNNQEIFMLAKLKDRNNAI